VRENADVKLALTAVEASISAPGEELETFTSPLGDAADATVPVGPLEVAVARRPSGVGWSVANRSDRTVDVRYVSMVADVRETTGAVHMFRHGYQSWSPSGVATLGVDADPSLRANFPFVQGVYHADGRAGRDGELRSEWCTVLGDERDPSGRARPLVLGFDGGHDHDGTFRLRQRDDGSVELRLEAFLGGATLRPGEQRALHAVDWSSDDRPAPEGLERWAATTGRANGALVDAPFTVGWCSWYHFFGAVTEADIRRNLAAAERLRWPFDVFQVDDGFQAAIGDWRITNDTFPSGLEGLAAAIRSAGMRPGLWLAPFLVAPDSEVARAHPEWIARAPDDAVEPLRSWWNPDWRGGEDGFMYSLDTTHPEVLEHLEALTRELVAMGFDYLKLDFTFAPSVDGRWGDSARTPAQRVRAGFDAIRRGAGDETFILGCGVPLANVVGVVDANRIGADVAPIWSLDPAQEIVPGYLDVQPATRGAFAATLARSFMHRHLWSNDPDCVMLRSSDTELPAAAAETWARCVGLSGGLVMVSDDLGDLGTAARTLLDEIVVLGLESDGRARSGHPARCLDLMDRAVPATLATGTHTLTADLSSGASRLTEA
jgi:alpha-galactosidase